MCLYLTACVWLLTFCLSRENTLSLCLTAHILLVSQEYTPQQMKAFYDLEGVRLILVSILAPTEAHASLQVIMDRLNAATRNIKPEDSGEFLKKIQRARATLSTVAAMQSVQKMDSGKKDAELVGVLVKKGVWVCTHPDPKSLGSDIAEDAAKVEQSCVQLRHSDDGGEFAMPEGGKLSSISFGYASDLSDRLFLLDDELLESFGTVRDDYQALLGQVETLNQVRSIPSAFYPAESHTACCKGIFCVTPYSITGLFIKRCSRSLNLLLILPAFTSHSHSACQYSLVL